MVVQSSPRGSARSKGREKFALRNAKALKEAQPMRYTKCWIVDWLSNFADHAWEDWRD
jgi:hypothetical protein